MSAEAPQAPPAIFGYFLNVCSLLHFGYFSDAEKALTEFLKDTDELAGPDRTYAIETAEVLQKWIRAKQENKNG